MIRFLTSFLFLPILAWGVNGDRQISREVYGHPLVIKTCDHDAGAVCSLTWNGREYIDDYDHGRQLQSAVTFDGKEENYNPTEAGANYLVDRVNPWPSTSKLKVIYQTDISIATLTQMAYWKPVNGKKLSDHHLYKSITIGYRAIPNVIAYVTRFICPADDKHTFAKYEVLTGYMPKVFSEFYTYNHVTKKLNPLSDGPGEQSKPIVFSTLSGFHAMGIYSKGAPQSTYPDAGYGRWNHRLDRVVKWNTVQRFKPPTKTEYSFVSFVVVGSKPQVIESMGKLITMHPRGRAF